MQIDDLLHKIDEKEGEVARAVQEKEEELLIMQEGMDSTLKELSEMRIVGSRSFIEADVDFRRHQSSLRCAGRHPHPGPPQRAQCHHRLDTTGMCTES